MIPRTLINYKKLLLTSSHHGSTVNQLIRRFFRPTIVFGDFPNKESTFAQYLANLGYSEKRLQDEIRKVLTQSFGNPITEYHLKMMGNEGIHALATSVRHELERDSTPYDIVHFVVPHHSLSMDLSMRHGQTIMHLARDDDHGKMLIGEYLECVCGGNMSCSTCHVILDPDSFSKCGPPSEAECDMLGLAYEPTETSRLGCQVVMKKELAGMTVTIPDGVYNHWR